MNAVEHGSEPGAPISRRFRARKRQVSVCVRDRGLPGVAVPLVAPSAPRENQTHGRGRLIMQALAERYENVARGSGAEARLEFRRTGQSVQAAA